VQSMLDLFEQEYGFKAYMHHFAVLGQCDSCRSEEGHPHD
jgi:Fe2+ or Zn2+ uptake regulation protein